MRVAGATVSLLSWGLNSLLVIFGPREQQISFVIIWRYYGFLNLPCDYYAYYSVNDLISTYGYV